MKAKRKRSLKPTPADAARDRRLKRICLGLELDPFAGSIIVDLLERLEELERELERLARGGWPPV